MSVITAVAGDLARFLFPCFAVLSQREVGKGREIKLCPLEHTDSFMAALLLLRPVIVPLSVSSHFRTPGVGETPRRTQVDLTNTALSALPIKLTVEIDKCDNSGVRSHMIAT